MLAERGRTGRAAAKAASLIVMLGLVAASCGPQPGAERGAELFGDPRLSPSPSNRVACSTCHAVTPDGDAPQPRFDPGFTLYRAYARPRLFCDGFDTLLDAVNLCLTEFMRAEPLKPDDTNGLALLAYLRTLGAGAPGSGDVSEPARSCALVKDIDARYLASIPLGDAGRGAVVFERGCRRCHGEARSGEGRLSPAVPIVPDDTVREHGAMARAFVVEKVRHGKFFGIGGTMPPYAPEVLSDAALGDLLSFLGL